MKRVIGIVVMLGAVGAIAGGSADSKAISPRIESMASQERTACVSLTVPADCFTITVAFETDDPDFSRRIADLKAADTILRSNAMAQAVIVNGSAADVLVRYAQQSSTDSRKDSTTIYRSIVYPVTKDSSELDIINDVHAMLKRITWPGRIVSRVTWQRLAVKDPERYRRDLLQLVAEDVKMVRSVFGDTVVVSVGHLQAPIHIGEHTDMSVELLLDYRMDVQLEK